MALPFGETPGARDRGPRDPGEDHLPRAPEQRLRGARRHRPGRRAPGAGDERGPSGGERRRSAERRVTPAARRGAIDATAAPGAGLFTAVDTLRPCFDNPPGADRLGRRASRNDAGTSSACSRAGRSAPEEDGMFTIIISEKGGAERRETFDKNEINVGRVQGNDLMLPKGNVSKHHARLLFRDGRFIVTDLKSTNGTYVNGRKISQATIVREGDKIYIGDFVLRLETGHAVAAADGVADESAARATRSRGSRRCAMRGAVGPAAARCAHGRSARRLGGGDGHPGLLLGASDSPGSAARRAPANRRTSATSRSSATPTARARPAWQRPRVAARAQVLRDCPSRRRDARARPSAVPAAPRAVAPRSRGRPARDAAAGRAPPRPHHARRPRGRTSSTSRPSIRPGRRRGPRRSESTPPRASKPRRCATRARRPEASTSSCWRATRCASWSASGRSGRCSRTIRPTEIHVPRPDYVLAVRGTASSARRPFVHERGGAVARRRAPRAPVGRAAARGEAVIERRLARGARMVAIAPPAREQLGR